VDLDNHISVTWMIDTIAELTFYKIERSGNGQTYKVIDQLSAPATLNFFETYIDSGEVMPEHNPYFYQITAVDSCQNQYKAPFVKTVHLDGELFDYYIANLEWNDFELQGATVLRYNLYRDYGFGYQLIQTLPFGVTEYSDSLQQFLDEQGTFCYRIEAVYDLSLSNGYTATLSSWSNVKCIIHRPIIYIPNAFRPGSTVAGNNVFRPTMHFAIEPKAYLMQIYNRWGGLVFETRDSLQGWDGTDHGKEAQQGGYAYLIQFYSNDEVRVERKGMVLLVR
jgi:gliding motility-associated-like protein